MIYKYHYTGEQDVELPTVRINTEGKDKDFVYETTEPINHPDFPLISEAPGEPQIPAQTEEPQPAQEQPQEVPQETQNVSVAEVQPIQ